MGLRSALFGSALPLAGFELALDFRAGWYRSGSVVTRDPLALPGASFGRDRAKWDDVGGLPMPVAAGVPGIYPGLGYAAREGVTNAIYNSSAAGAAVGVTPTRWQNSGAQTQTVVGVGTENGLPYVDIRVAWDGTQPTTRYAQIIPGQPADYVPGVAGDIFVARAYIRLIAGAWPATANMQIREFNSSNGFVATRSVGFKDIALGAPARSVAFGGALTGSTTDRVYSTLEFSALAGEVADCTVRVYGWTLNKSAIQVPYIATAAGSAAMTADNLRFTQPMPTAEDWVFVSAVTALRTTSQHSGNGNKRYWRILDGTIERIGIYRNIPIQGGAQGRINAIVTGADGDVKRPAGGDIPQAGRMVSVVRKVGTGYSIATRAPDGTIQIGGAQTVAVFPSPLVDIQLAPELEGYHEFLGWRRGTFSDDQVRGMLAALA